MTRSEAWRLRLGDFPTTSIERDLARAIGVPFIDLESYNVSPGLLRKLPTRRMIRHRCVPVVHNPRRVILAVDALDSVARLSLAREALGLPAGRLLEFALTTSAGVDRALAQRTSLRE